MAHPLNITSIRLDRRTLLRGGLAVAAASAWTPRPSHAGPAVSTSGAAVDLSDTAIGDLQKSIKGRIIVPASEDYEQARRLWSPSFNRRPALIVKCTSVADIQATVQFARTYNLLTAIRCGGHSHAGYSMVDNGLVIDLSPFNAVTVDPARKIARVSGGALLGDLDRAAAPHKLATTAGVVSHTGVGGLATGAGQGRLARKFGLTIDNNRGVEMILADGSLVRANPKENADLYWAVRGGGGNFGIVTQFEFQLHDYDHVVTSLSYVYPAAKANDLLKLYVDMCETAPPELSLGAGLRTSDRGETTASISCTFLGSKAAAEKAMAAVQVLGTPINSRGDEMAYTRLQSIADGDLLSDRHTYGKNGFFTKIDEKLLETTVDYVTRANVPRTAARFAHQGGAISKVAEKATAFAQRDGVQQASLDVDWKDGMDPAAGIKHTRDLWALMEPMSTGGFYINSLYDDSEERVRRSFRGNLTRLVDIKTKVDPTNFFRLNPNIRPKTQPV